MFNQVRLIFEFKQDKKCSSTDVIDSGTKRYYNYMRPNELGGPDCFEILNYSRPTTVYVGMTCDYAYTQDTVETFFKLLKF